ncbi:peroxiredoxin [Pseudoprimorskyibacter insulae]|uniref:Glutathione-dependent peroxiredoxin n=1 Tax=Pseudoprimorskyibacter insulae TaxID=1695997 RepID=A0A2R8AWV9_9RHOB|nr:peroxiredoxin [Pseudoprimorskyibacter insulae]SPF80427.1 Putative peroxiredoxin [Pseudoprimorskyibacter insulae]
MKAGVTLPNVTFKTRVRDEAVGGPNPFRWQDVTTADYFAGKRVILFSLPGAFTPTCSTYQLPGFEKNFAEFQKLGIDAIYCMSVNDSFVMNKWAESQKLESVKVIPDGSGEFTRKIGMLVAKDNLGFGARSWRYAAIVKDGVVEAWFEEPGLCDNHGEDPYGVSSPENLLKHLNEAVQPA